MQKILRRLFAGGKTRLVSRLPTRLAQSTHAIMYEKVVGSSLVERYVDMKPLKRRFHRLDVGMRWRLYCVALRGERFQVEAP